MSKTMIAVVLDASGSMAGIKQETISAFNKFVEEQKALPGEALLTLVTFNDRPKVVRDAVDLKAIPALTDDSYRCDGYTALLDAMGLTIDKIGTKLAALPETERPDRAIVVVLTDGHENMSKEYSRERVMEMVKHQEEKYAWQFVFLGAGKDAINQAGALGINSLRAMSYNATDQGIGKAAASVSNLVGSYRSVSHEVLGDYQASFTNEDRTKNQ